MTSKSFLSEKRRNMRCHYAVDLGNQRIETEDGRNRIKGIRYNFNSPISTIRFGNNIDWARGARFSHLLP